MALSIPPGVGTEVSVPDAAGTDRQGGAEMHDGILSAVGMRDRGDEHSGGSCAFVGKGAAEAIDLGADGRPERTYGDTVVHGVSDVTQEAVLGQSFLGERVLCGYGRAQR